MHAVAITEKSLDLIATNNGGVRPQVRPSPYPNGCAADYFLLPTNPNDHAQIINTDVFFETYEFVGPESLFEFRPIQSLVEEQPKSLTIDRVWVNLVDSVFLDCVELYVPESALVVDIQRDIDTHLGSPAIGIWIQYDSAERTKSGSLVSKVWRVGVIADGATFSPDSRHLSTTVVEGRAWHLIDIDDVIRWAPCCE